MRPKILFLIPSLKGGGAEKVLLNLLKGIPSSEFDIELISLFKGELPSTLHEKIKYRFVFNKSFRGNVLLFKFFNPKWLFRHIVGNPDNYNIIISYLHSPTMRIVGGAIGSKAVLINWIHNEFNSKKDLSRLFRNNREFERIMKGYHKTVFVAESARLSTIKLLPYLSSNSVTIYNTVESDKIRAMSEEAVSDPHFNINTINLISVGRFTKAKAFDRLLRIVKRISDSKINVHLHLIGEGSLLSSYKEEIKNLGIENLVTFTGFVENPYKYVAKADLFICSSLHEGYSTAVTESLIVGTPVITTLCSGMVELLGENGEYGIITNNDEASLSDVVLNIIQNKPKIKELREKATIRGNDFSASKSIGEVIKLFNSFENNI